MRVGEAIPVIIGWTTKRGNLLIAHQKPQGMRQIDVQMVHRTDSSAVHN